MKVTIEVFSDGEATFSIKKNFKFEPLFFDTEQDAIDEAKVRFGEDVEIVIEHLD